MQSDCVSTLQSLQVRRGSLEWLQSREKRIEYVGEDLHSQAVLIENEGNCVHWATPSAKASELSLLSPLLLKMENCIRSHFPKTIPTLSLNASKLECSRLPSTHLPTGRAPQATERNLPAIRAAEGEAWEMRWQSLSEQRLREEWWLKASEEELSAVHIEDKGQIAVGFERMAVALAELLVFLEESGLPPLYAIWLVKMYSPRSLRVQIMKGSCRPYNYLWVIITTWSYLSLLGGSG
jgi:hypothetical protein